MYEFLTGFMFWLSISICLIGMLVRIVLYVKGLNWQLDRVAYRVYPAQGEEQHSIRLLLSGADPNH